MARCKIHKKDREKFVKLVTQLNDLMEKIHEYNPNVFMFVAGEGETSFCLLENGSVLESNSMAERSSTVIEQVDVSYSDCGGW